MFPIMTTSKNSKNKKTTAKKAAATKAAPKKAGAKKAVAKKAQPASAPADKRKPGRPRKQAAQTVATPKKAATPRPIPNVQATGVEIAPAATTTTATGSTPVVTVSASWSNPPQNRTPLAKPAKKGFFARIFKRKGKKNKR